MLCTASLIFMLLAMRPSFSFAVASRLIKGLFQAFVKSVIQ